MNHLVKIISSDDGELKEKEDQFWCLVTIILGDPATLCSGEFFGIGQSGCEYETKMVKRGGITCPQCLDHIHKIKKVKL